MAALAGTGLKSAAAFGGAFGRAGPLAYLLITEGTLTGTGTTPWVWATRPPHDALADTAGGGFRYRAG